MNASPYSTRQSNFNSSVALLTEEEFIRPEGCFKEARQNKQVARKEILADLKRLSDTAREEKSRQIRKFLLEFRDFTDASTILIFASLSSEPDLFPLLDESDLGHVRFCFPRMERKSLALYAVESSKQLIQGQGKLLEPDPKKCDLVEVDDIEIALIPGLAFAERSGGRLGRGGGFYDKLLAEEFLHAQSIGVCFQSQIKSTLPLEPHDELVDGMVTETGLHLVH
ncbi:MAG: 5-formyltetrahydrofolate cyclo-ligase [Verrucomicrobiales bacterium]|jgi:5-formyltetrahydrofolate cyclo-ligase